MSSDPHAVRSWKPEERADLLNTWHCLLRVSSRVVLEFERRFEHEHRTSAREFDVLINLGNAPSEGLRMSDLAAVALLSSGGLTRLVGRLEERGLVLRHPDPADARAFHARLTDAGRVRLDEMRRTHDAVIVAIFGAHLDPAEVRRLGATLTRALG